MKNKKVFAALTAVFAALLCVSGCAKSGAGDPAVSDVRYSPVMIITPGRPSATVPPEDDITTPLPEQPSAEITAPVPAETAPEKVTEIPRTEPPTEVPVTDAPPAPTEAEPTQIPTEIPTEVPVSDPTEGPTAVPTEKATWDPSAYIQEDDGLPAARYYLEVSLRAQIVYIYSVDDAGEPQELVKTMLCSTGADGATPVRSWIILDDADKETYHLDTGFLARYEFEWLSSGCGQYMSRMWKLDYDDNGNMIVDTSGYLFHSVPYYSRNKDDLETEEWNKLGYPVSAGCVRLCVRDAHWIWEKVQSGSIVRTVEGTEDPELWARLKMPDLPPDVKHDPTDIY